MRNSGNWACVEKGNGPGWQSAHTTDPPNLSELQYVGILAASIPLKHPLKTPQDRSLDIFWMKLQKQPT